MNHYSKHASITDLYNCEQHLYAACRLNTEAANRSFILVCLRWDPFVGSAGIQAKCIPRVKKDAFNQDLVKVTHDAKNENRG